MQYKVRALNDYTFNQDIMSDFKFFDFFTNIKHSERPNIDVIKYDNKYFFKTNRFIKKGEILSINFNSIIKSKTNNSQVGGMNKNIKNLIKEFTNESKVIFEFIQKKNFNKASINDLKKNLNQSKFFKNDLSNKFIYRVAKLYKKNINTDQFGGDAANLQDGMTNKIERLPTVEVGSFIHHPQAITISQRIDKLHLLLDILGIIPGYGIAADTVNFLLYFVRGEYSDAFYSLICLIPTVGSLIGLSIKYLIKFIYNKNPDFRNYYNSVKSLKDITKELQIVENKNLNLDDIAYKDQENEYNP